MQNKNLLVLVILLLVSVGIALSDRGSSTPSSLEQWEIGAYRVRAGDKNYEWQDADQHIFHDKQTVFLEKMGLSRIKWELAKMHTETSPPFPQTVIDTAFFNYLGTQGWQLLQVQRDIQRQIYWFKRRISAQPVSKPL